MTEEQIALLRKEIEGDSRYKAHVAAGNDTALAEALNATDPAIRIRRGVVSRDELLSDFAGVLMALASKSEAIQARWDSTLRRMVYPRDTFNLASPKVDLLMSLAQSDGLLTAEEAEAILHRDGSRAELVCGSLVTADDVSLCFREERIAKQEKEPDA